MPKLIRGKAEVKIKELPAFLRNQAASHFYAIPEDDRKTYDDAVKHLKLACSLQPTENCISNNFKAVVYAKEKTLPYSNGSSTSSSPKTDPDLAADARTAFLARQFMRGLPKDLKIKLLQHDPTPTLDRMVSFVQRYRAIQEYTDDETFDNRSHVSATASAPSHEKAELLSVVKDLLAKQTQMDAAISRGYTWPFALGKIGF